MQTVFGMEFVAIKGQRNNSGLSTSINYFKPTPTRGSYAIFSFVCFEYEKICGDKKEQHSES